MTKSFDEIINEIKMVELKLLKCEPNSIMGVHWSSKLAGLKRVLSEVEMRDFEKWKSEYGLESEPNYSKETEYDCRAAYRAGQQYKQAEVDELKREMLNKANDAYADGQKSMRKMIKSNEDELQKRIDDASKELEYIHFYKTQNSNNAIKILKGDSHES